MVKFRFLLLGCLVFMGPASGFPQGRRPPIVREADFSGTSYLSLEDVAQIMKGQLRWFPVSQRVDLMFSKHTVQFSLGSEKIFVDGQPDALDKPTVKNERGIWVPRSFFSSSSLTEDFRKRIELDPRVAVVKAAVPEKKAPPAPPVEKKPTAKKGEPVETEDAERPPLRHAIRRIVIDPGHGGKDPGASGLQGMEEKSVNLWMGNELADALREKDFEVLMTRTDDSFIPLAERTGLANRNKADLFISLHCNASHSAKLNGFEVYFLSEKASDPHAAAVARKENASLEFEEKSVAQPVEAVLRSLAKNAHINQASQLGGIIDREVAKQLSQVDLGVKQAAFYVLRGAEMPAILIELGFLSNSREAQLLQDRGYRERLVKAIEKSILEYDRKQKS